MQSVLKKWLLSGSAITSRLLGHNAERRRHYEVNFGTATGIEG